MRQPSAMKMRIQDNCINCAACDEECIPGAISAGEEFFVVNPELCTGCEGEYDKPKCADVCPIEECVVLAA